MIGILWGIGGMAGILLIAFLLSSNRRAIRIRTVAAALGLRLGGRTVYASGAEDRVVMGSGPAPTVADLPHAITLARRVGTVALAGALGNAAEQCVDVRRMTVKQVG